MRALVTGGAGFIGSHVVDRLLASGHEVTVLDDLSSGRRAHLPEGVPLEVADVDSEAAAGLVGRLRPEAVFHLAAQVDAARSVADPLADAAVNVLGTVRLLAAARDAGVRRFVFASSAAVYGEPRELPVAEDHPPAPLSPYGIGKLAGEQYLAFFAREHGLEGVALRFANVYGPRQGAAGEAGVVAVFCRRLLAGEAVVVHGDGLQSRDFVFVEDVANAAVAALAAPPGVYNVATGVERRVIDLLSVLAARLDSQAPIRHEAPRPGDPRRSALAPGKAAAAFGFRAAVGLDEGLTRTADWFAEHEARGAR